MRQIKITKSLTGRDSHSLDIYFQEVSKVSPITPEEEAELARKIRKGDHGALEKLVNANLRFVISVAKQYQHNGLSLSDLISEGNLGLLKAAQRFDETKGFKFISYAVWWIRQSILQALNNHASMVRLPLNKIGALNKIKKASATLEQMNEREPSAEELSEVLSVSLKAVQEAVSAPCQVSSLNAPLGTSEENSVLIDTLDDPNVPVTDDHLIKESLNKTIDRALATLTRKENDIIRKFYGIGSTRNVNLEEIGMEFHLSKERVRQIKQRAIKKLRDGKFHNLFRGAREISANL